MKNILPADWRLSLVARFGTATLHRDRAGRYELQGGSPADHAEAREWASLFQHDAVFAVHPRIRLERRVR